MQRRSVNEPVRIAAIAFALTAIFVVFRLLLQDGPSAFVLAGDQFSNQQQVPANVTVRQDSTGYDGQYVLRLALDPFTTERTDFGVTLDRPAYRQQRIVLPLVAWLLSKVTSLPVTWLLIAINTIAIAVAAGFASVLARELGRNPAWGLLLAMLPGVLIGLARDLTEPLSWCFLLAALCARRSGRHWVAAALFVAAVGTRETTLLVPAMMGGILCVDAVRQRRIRWAEAASLVSVAAAWLAWQVVLINAWGRAPGGSRPTGELGLPFVGVAKSLFGGNLPSGVNDVFLDVQKQFWVLERIMLLVVFAAAAFAVRRSRVSRAEAAAWVAVTALAVSLIRWAWEAQFLRATNEAMGLSVLVLLGRRSYVSRLALEVAAALSVLIFMFFIRFP